MYLTVEMALLTLICCRKLSFLSKMRPKYCQVSFGTSDGPPIEDKSRGGGLK